MKIKTNSNKVNKAWLNEHVNDTYVKLAQKEGYRARAAYKLQELDQTFRLVKQGMTVVDLGSAPGAWSQYLRRTLGAASMGGSGYQVIALDMLPMEAIEGVRFIQGDFREQEVLAQLENALNGKKAGLVVSDMAPNLSGLSDTDAARVALLVELAVDFSVKHLIKGGHLVVKVFHGGAYDECVKLLKRHFKQVKAIKPKASRSKSTETFLVGLGLTD
jgi:23S rRNA (uridine2552-2'-O)-methyltransferase